MSVARTSALTRFRRRHRERLVREQEGRCYYCQRHMMPAGSDDPRAATLDDIVPQSAGGPDDPRNYCAACRECNERKADAIQYAPVPKHVPKKERQRLAHDAERQARKARERLKIWRQSYGASA